MRCPSADYRPEIQKIAGAVINGLQLVKQLQQVTGDREQRDQHGLSSGSVNVASLLSALDFAASQGVTPARTVAVNPPVVRSAVRGCGKGSVDQNTRMQLENARAVNELIEPNELPRRSTKR